MAKVILSRKGFDSSYGGGASPIMPNGDLISIPIPANEKEMGIPYTAIQYEDQSYLDIMKSLGLKVPKHKMAHFDPDLIQNACERPKKWKGVFGQQGAALTHLDNQGVETGDIFLFFGSFKRTVLQRKRLKFERDYERHIIFGFLVIGEIIDIKDQHTHPIFNQHPHFQNHLLYAPRNKIYVAKDDNSFGTFKYREELVLTKEGFPKSFWDLPPFFHPSQGTTISRHSAKDISRREEQLLLKSRGIGQDFVISGNQAIEDWAWNRINNSKRIGE